MRRPWPTAGLLRKNKEKMTYVIMADVDRRNM
jgi:hypothetical protein